MKNILLCQNWIIFGCVLTKIFDPIDINSIYKNNNANETNTRISMFDGGGEGESEKNKDEIGKSEHYKARVSLIDNIISKSIEGSKSAFPKSEDDQKKVLTLVELDVRNEEPFDKKKMKFTVSGSEGGKKKAKKTKTIQKTIFIKDYMGNETKEINGVDDEKDFITKNEPSSILISDIPDLESKKAKPIENKEPTKHWTTIYGKDGLEKVLMDVKTITIVESIIEEPAKAQTIDSAKETNRNTEEPFGITSKNILDIKKGIKNENGDSKEVKSKLFSSIYESLTKKASVLESMSILGESIKKTDKKSSTIGKFVHHLSSTETEPYKTSIQISNAISQTGYKTSESSISAEKEDSKVSKSNEKEISRSLNSKSEIASKESISLSKSKEKADESISKSLQEVSKEKSKSKEEEQKSFSKSYKEASKKKSKSEEEASESISKSSKEFKKEKSKSAESVSKEFKQSSKEQSKSLKELKKSTSSKSKEETNLSNSNASVETKKQNGFFDIIKGAEGAQKTSSFTISPSISAQSIQKISKAEKTTFAQTGTISTQNIESISKSMKDASKSISKEQEKSSESISKSMKDASKSISKEQEKSSESISKSMKDASKSISKEQEKSLESTTKSMKDVSKSISKELEKSSESESKSSISVSKSIKDVSKSISKEKEKSVESASKISLSISKSLVEVSKSISKESVKSSESFSKSMVKASKSISKESVKSSESFSKSMIEASKSISKESVKSSESISKSIQTLSKQKSKSLESKQEQKSESAKEKSESIEERKEEKSKYHKEMEKSISKQTISSQEQQSKSSKTVSASIENNKKDTSKSLDKISRSLQKESSKSESKNRTTSSKKTIHAEQPQSASFSTTSPFKVLDVFKMAVNPPTSLTSNNTSFSKGLDVTTSSNILIKNKQLSSNATLAISQTILPTTINSSTQISTKKEDKKENKGLSNTFTSISPTSTSKKDKGKAEKETKKEKDTSFTSISPTITNKSYNTKIEKDKIKDRSNTHTSISQSQGTKTSLLKSKTLESISSLLQRSSILNNIKSIMKGKNVDYDTIEINETSDSSSQESNIPISSIINILKNMPNTPDISSNKNAHEILKKVNEQNNVNKNGPVFVTGRINQGNDTGTDKGDGFKFWGFISSALNNREE
ncbi:hypothetical protein CWI38_0028p0070 [Hamiltosporidium tvaerminnensis]|uniref:Uncharacterized protein n=2 Tax=Hamiltosporidium TaxID=1176354 RepID=A0A4V2JUU4_9MICR|nr:hypothetical protein LUQ84_001364 [Hamiltosporidium tvaerminnensis]TBU01512.1 hypothetical protein CWI39_1370p0010 [Hamiltosporidium magnivora]TBU20735.1 hypothetical protein CWI38_0028p0070 [Hamiltosporidium tvaerminnensis]